MNLLFASTGSYPRIGDSAEHQVLRRTIALWEKGVKSEEDLREAEKSMTKAAIQEQLEAGLDLLTDGQIRWYDPISHIAGKLEGVKINGLLRFFDTNFYFRQPVVHARLKRTAPILLDDYKFAASISTKPVKAVLTGPYTLARLSITENSSYQSFDKMFEDYVTVIGEEIRSLLAAGANTIQIDEPAILKHPEDFEKAAVGIKQLAGMKGKANLALYTYFGDVAQLYAKMESLPVEVLGIDFTYNEKLIDLIRAEGSDKALGLGLINGRNTKLESEKELSLALEKLLPAVSSSYSYLNPSCGLEHLPREKAFSKLKNMVEIGRKFLSGK